MHSATKLPALFTLRRVITATHMIHEPKWHHTLVGALFTRESFQQQSEKIRNDDGQGHDPAPTEIPVNVPICFSNLENTEYSAGVMLTGDIQLVLTACLESLPKISLGKGGKCCELTQILANWLLIWVMRQKEEKFKYFSSPAPSSPSFLCKRSVKNESFLYREWVVVGLPLFL